MGLEARSSKTFETNAGMVTKTITTEGEGVETGSFAYRRDLHYELEEWVGELEKDGVAGTFKLCTFNELDIAVEGDVSSRFSIPEVSMQERTVTSEIPFNGETILTIGGSHEIRVKRI